MATSLYDMSVASYLQTLGAVSGFLDKGKAFAAENNIELDEIVNTQLRSDMFPFRFQVVSVWHHSLGAIKGIQAGEFGPPPALGELDYAALQGLVEEASNELGAMSSEAIDALAGKSVVFKLPGLELPFTAENFILSFSLPNVYFHATTAYDMLRMAGAPLGKQDFMGQMRLATPV